MSITDIKIAELNIRLKHNYDIIPKLCKDYIITDATEFDIHADATASDIVREQFALSDYPPEHLETIALYRKIAEKMPEFDGLLMHGAVIEYKGNAVAFLAHSGVGKSTHIRLWRELLGTECKIINGDKPILRKEENCFTAYGTPWCGKENWGRNASAPLRAICFIERDAENSIAPMDKTEALTPFLSQIYIPTEKIENRLKGFELLDSLINNTPIYRLKCNKNPEAAVVAFKGIFGEEEFAKINK